jgi:G3E family GTPase
MIMVLSMLLQDMSGDNCELEMVAGGCDYDCHRRRFKTKLISMGMCGYDRVIVEPSGIYDVDEFFDVLHEEPLDNWYEIGNVITIVDSKLDNDMSVHSDYMLACQLADAGSVILSRTKEADKSDIDNTIVHLNNALKNVRCSRVLDKEIICKDWDTFTEKDYEKILNSGYVMENYTKLFSQDDEGFQSVYYMNKKFTKDELQKIIKEVMDDKKCGNIFRVKGFMKISDNSWIQLNATHNEIRIEPIDKGQEVIIIIGEELDKQRLDKHFM